MSSEVNKEDLEVEEFRKSITDGRKRISPVTFIIVVGTIGMVAWFLYATATSHGL